MQADTPIVEAIAMSHKEGKKCHTFNKLALKEPDGRVLHLHFYVELLRHLEDYS